MSSSSSEFMFTLKPLQRTFKVRVKKIMNSKKVYENNVLTECFPNLLSISYLHLLTL